MAMARSLCKRRLPPLGRLIVWVRAAGMIGRIDDLSDAGNLLRDQRLNSLLQRHICHATSLAPATHGDVGDVLFDVEEDNVPPVVCQGRVDVLVEQLLDGNSLGIGPFSIRVVDPETALLGSL